MTLVKPLITDVELTKNHHVSAYNSEVTDSTDTSCNKYYTAIFFTNTTHRGMMVMYNAVCSRRVSVYDAPAGSRTLEM